jgi:hypothetical protein
MSSLKFHFSFFLLYKWIFPSTKFELTVKQSQFVPIFFVNKTHKKKTKKTDKKETNFKVFLPLWNVCSWPESSWWKLWKCFLCLPESQLTQLHSTKVYIKLKTLNWKCECNLRALARFTHLRRWNSTKTKKKKKDFSILAIT